MTDETARAVPSASREDLHAVRKVHLVAVCGVGMAALAGMFKQRGFLVTGSDENVYPPMSLVLQRLGIEVMQGYRAENLAGSPDLVIIGNKVSRGNPEVEAVLSSGVPYLSFPEALARFFIADRRSLVVAGTHGKTTSAAMLAWVLERAGRDPSVMVGGESLDFGGNFKLGEGELFVIEGDEYDSAFFDKGPKFLHYRPAAVLLNAVEFDHADIYRDLDAVKQAFRRLVALLSPDAPLVVCADFPHALDVCRSAPGKLLTFGIGDGAEWSIRDLRDVGGTTCFEVWQGGVRRAELAMAPAGAINARNALGVYVLAHQLGLEGAEISSAFATFSGVARRQELVGEFDGVLLVDDFAHHPTAVAGTLSALRQRYPQRRIWAIFEPRSNTSRRRVFQKEYARAFADADRVIIGGVVQKASDAVSSQDLFSPAELAADLKELGKPAQAISSPPEIAALLGDSARAGDLVVLMSNGDFGGLRALLVSALRHRAKLATDR